MHGYQLKNLTMNYLPYLKTFQCAMGLYITNSNDIKNQINSFMRSFENQFWIEDHQWFIRCYLNEENNEKYSIIYHTLSYRFIHSITIKNYIWSGSNSIHENDFYQLDSFDMFLIKLSNSQQLNQNYQITSQKSLSFCQRINQIFQWNTNEIREEEELTISSNNEISIEFPLQKYFCNSLLNNLHKIITLNILLSSNSNNQNQSKLQNLLNQIPNLYTLNIIYSNSIFSLTNIKNSSVRKLKFPLDKSIFYNMKQCIELCQSSLGKQCEILTIGLKNRQCLIYIIDHMIHLRLLTFKIYDNKLILPTNSINLITWLQSSLPSTIKITKNTCCQHFFHLWIR
ncbi:hypothetical protein I4U23_000228 [Adineta vaga]|nr:hypothetical protein I4U23_000228 [Adineta vaga]